MDCNKYRSDLGPEALSLVTATHAATTSLIPGNVWHIQTGQCLAGRVEQRSKSFGLLGTMKAFYATYCKVGDMTHESHAVAQTLECELHNLSHDR